MKRLIFSVLFLVSFITGFAQQEAGSLTIQPKVEINLANYRGDDFIDKGESSDLRAGVAVGAELEYQFTHQLSASLAAMYSMQGAKVHMGASSPGYIHDLIFKTDYLVFPVMANFYITKNVALKLGLQPGFMFRKKYDIPGNEKLSGSFSRVDIQTNDFDLSIPVGFGLYFGSVVLDCRYNLGLTHIFKGYSFENSVFQFTLGYKIGLK
jgi:hypothetical protein